MENSTLIFKILSAIAFSLLAIVTLGVAYLTVSDWRDRRRRDNERREMTVPTTSPKPNPPKKAKR